jgi:hypothetical protein
MTRGISGTRPTTACSFCKELFGTLPYKIKSGKPLYCSIKCKNEGIKRKATEPCQYCGNPVTRRISAFRRGGAKMVFCNRRCASKWRGANPSAERLANYGINANKFRGLYGKYCFICGFDRVVEYCHIIPARIGGTTHPSNIITLCPNHHTLMDKGLLTKEEDELLDDHLINAWGDPLAARFGEAPEIRKRRKYTPPPSGGNSSEPSQD